MIPSILKTELHSVRAREGRGAGGWGFTHSCFSLTGSLSGFREVGARDCPCSPQSEISFLMKYKLKIFYLMCPFIILKAKGSQKTVIYLETCINNFLTECVHIQRILAI